MSSARTKSTSLVDSKEAGRRHLLLPSSTTTTFANTAAEAPDAAKRRWSTLGLLIKSSNTILNCSKTGRHIKAKLNEHCGIEYTPEECEITPNRLERARKMVVARSTGCALADEEKLNLVRELKCIKSLLTFDVLDHDDDDDDFLDELDALFEEGGEEEEVVDQQQQQTQQQQLLLLENNHPPPPPPQDTQRRRSSAALRLRNLRAQLITLKIRSRLDTTHDGVLGVQADNDADVRGPLNNEGFPKTYRRCSVRNSKYRGSVVDEKFVKYCATMEQNHGFMGNIQEEGEGDEEEMDVEYCDYVRKPDLANIIEQYDAMCKHPKYSLKQVIMSRRFFLYAHRFANAQFQKTLVFPSLPQPLELYHDFTSAVICGECIKVTEKQRTRPKGHRFIITADTQYGILMDGFAMNKPSWSTEIEMSRKCVEQINAMHGTERPLFVCVCGDLVDTESSFSGAIASWKKVMKGWERNLVFAQQVNDFKRVWSGLHSDIALVCLCGNHDVGNRPTKASIEHWTSSFGDEYLSFWANGSFNLCLNNCLFSNPTGAPDLFDEQLRWMDEKLAYARENDATHIFVYGHFPWFLKHEEEADDELTSHSSAPSGWGPPGTKFEDGYFTIPYEYRKIAMAMFKKYDVTACFSGHFHQNVTAQSSWGMPMIVTGPLSMNLHSSISHELSNGEVNGIGMRIVDVGEKGEFKHKWTLLDNEEEIFEHAIERCERQLMSEEKIVEALIK